MKVKVGQWFRTKKATIEQVKEFVTKDELWFTGDGIYTYRYEDVEVADTPQELAQEGDLVTYINGNKTKTKIATKELIKAFKEIPYVITKILTPNLNGGYDLQWSKN